MNVKEARDVSIDMVLRICWNTVSYTVVCIKFPTGETDDREGILLWLEVWGSGICVFKPWAVLVLAVCVVRTDRDICFIGQMRKLKSRKERNLSTSPLNPDFRGCSYDAFNGSWSQL